MTNQEIRDFYAIASTRAHTHPTSAEFKEWIRLYSFVDKRDFQSVLDTHFAKERWLPKENELRPLIDAAQRKRSIGVSQEKFFTVFECTVCHVTRSGFISTHDYQPRYCVNFPQKETYEHGEVCGGNMEEVRRVPASALASNERRV